MGDMADYYRDLELDYHLEMASRIVVIQDFKWWRTGDGSRIKVSNMSISHLTNSINKIKREGWREQWLEPLEKELKRRNRTIL